MLVDFSVYLITDRHQLHTDHTLFSAVDAALSGGVRAIQLREKDLNTADLFELAGQLRQLTARYQAKLLINDRVDIALAAGADGVHLTEHSLPVATARQLMGPDKLVGASCHSLKSAQQAERHGADFITFSPIFYTPSKAGYGAPQGVEKLAEICQQLSIPVLALGGITVERVPAVCQAGASGVALISAILAQPDPAQAAVAFCNARN